MNAVARAAGVAVAALASAAMLWGSTAALKVHDAEHGVVRLAWSVRPERIENCRARTADELARLPQHMRQATVCEGETAQYQLTVRRDGEVVVRQRVRGGGWRRDRRLYVFHEIPVRPGDSAIDVQFDRVGSGGANPAGAAAAPDVTPPHLAFSERLSVTAREVVLITYSPERAAFIAVRRPVAPQ
jgi:hypothetical protein